MKPPLWNYGGIKSHFYLGRNIELWIRNYGLTLSHSFQICRSNFHVYTSSPSNEPTVARIWRPKVVTVVVEQSRRLRSGEEWRLAMKKTFPKPKISIVYLGGFPLPYYATTDLHRTTSLAPIWLTPKVVTAVVEQSRRFSRKVAH